MTLSPVLKSCLLQVLKSVLTALLTLVGAAASGCALVPTIHL